MGLRQCLTTLPADVLRVKVCNAMGFRLADFRSCRCISRHVPAAIRCWHAGRRCWTAMQTNDAAAASTTAAAGRAAVAAAVLPPAAAAARSSGRPWSTRPCLPGAGSTGARYLFYRSAICQHCDTSAVRCLLHSCLLQSHTT